MADKIALQHALKGLIARGSEIAAKPDVTPEELTELKSIQAKADQVKDQLDSLDKIDALKRWASEPNGESAVRAGFVREVADGEGELPGISADASSGEMYAFDERGEAKMNALKKKDYKSAFNQYLRQAALHKDDWRSYLKGDALKVLNEGADTSGGFWIPPDYRPELVKKMAPMTVIRPNASVFTTGTNNISFPKVTYTASQVYTSGVRFTWSGSNQAANLTEATNPVAGKIDIPIQLATAAIIIDRSQVEDNSFDLLGYITSLMAESFGMGMEDAYINGDGVGKPHGFLQHANAASASSATTDGMYVPTGTSAKFDWGTVSAASSALPTKGLVGLEAALPPQYEANAAFYASKAMYSIVRAFTDTAGRPLWNQADQYPMFTNGMQATLLGYPIRKTQLMLSSFAADSLCMAFGDMTGYYIADRVGLSVEILREIYGLRDQWVVYARMRTGGQLVQPWKLKLLKMAAS
jgi:HK97 family phage major capsid protein